MASITSERKNKNGSEVRYRGVLRRSQSGKYGTQIKHPEKKTLVWLGTFDSAIDAAKAYDATAIKFRGPNKAKTNFPIPKNHSNNVVIQTPTTIGSSTSTTNPPSQVPLPNHVISSTSHNTGHSSSSSTTNNSLTTTTTNPPPPMLFSIHVRCSTSHNQGHSESSSSFALTVEVGK